jgi:osmoprotectant transport system permease protein
VGAVIGVQSLGSLFTDGFQRGIQAEIIAGLVATVGLALLFDGALVLLGRILMPWTRRSVPARVSTPIEVSAA